MSTAGWSRRLWRRAASVLGLVAAFQAPPAAPVAECELANGSHRRVYHVVDRGPASDPRWWLTMRSPALGERIAELPLPGARVERSADRLRITSRSPNGGLAVEIDAGADTSALDVFVNYELEVNVWRDLSPDVEHMNTDGPISRVTCRLAPQPAP